MSLSSYTYSSRVVHSGLAVVMRELEKTRIPSDLTSMISGYLDKPNSALNLEFESRVEKCRICRQNPLFIVYAVNVDDWGTRDGIICCSECR